MTADKTMILSWLADLSAAIVTDADDAAGISARLAAAQLLSADALALEALAVARIVAESVDDLAGFDRLAVPVVEKGTSRDAMTVIVGMALAVAGCRVRWPSRPMARAARARVAAAGEAALAVASGFGADGADLYAWLSAVIAVSCRLISDLAANAVPIVQIQTGLSLPSTVLAYQLYGDAARAESLVDIASAATPLVMPVRFDALAS